MAQRLYKSFTCKNVELASSYKTRLELKNHYSHATNQNILFVSVKVWQYTLSKQIILLMNNGKVVSCLKSTYHSQIWDENTKIFPNHAFTLLEGPSSSLY